MSPDLQNILNTVDVIIADDARESWVVLNANETLNASSKLLGSLETLSSDLVGEFTIVTQRILLKRTMFNNSFMADLNSSIVINIPDTNMSNVFITTVILSTPNNFMPARNSSFDANLFNATSNETVNDNTINAAVVLVRINETIQNVSLKYNKLNSSLRLNPQCVFWNFTLFDQLGAWDDEGCVIILTPLFGLTWSLGVATMVSSTNKGVHIAFAFFNSLQGFFILVFGTLFDSKIRSILSRRLPTPSTGSNPTTSTSGGVSSFSGINLINRLRGRRYMYRVSQAANSSSSGASESFVHI
ncbi:adhesion G protein-coupled receptor F5-like protein [Lates japonicus]|uniref:Adhesion G protein-coupled receptor F5-like protein n=1 Tax=Lates japonicus TaxID=270547 RepID=A0AAD3N3Z8_LATJO|nr:adhesion G protein-coupled receptor F5-like protein [Lates japonicus]